MKDKILNLIKDKHHNMLEGAVEYAYQVGNIDSVEYDYWCEYIREVDFKETNEILTRWGNERD